MPPSLRICALLASLAAAAAAAAAPLPLSISVDVSRVVHEVSPRFVSANFDWHTDAEETPAWVNASAMKIDLANADLRALAAAFAPAHLRIGGSEGDCIVYEISGGDCAAHPMEAGTFCYNNSDGSGFPGAFCLSTQRWDALVEFASAAGLHIAFGLNAMLGRNGNPKTPLDTSNIRALLQRVHSNNASAAFARTIDFELGNELEYKVDVAVYAADVLVVRALIDSIWGDLAAADRPRLIANDENPLASYWSTLLPLAGSALHAASWHSYVGYGLDPTLPTMAFDASFLAKTPAQALPMINVSAAFAAAGGERWVGETAMAWHSGRDNTTNSYLSGPWYINALGSLAATHSVHCRQTLLGGYYELVDRFSITPNPDYFLALLWKRTMGERVLATASSLPEQVLAYAHCAAGGGGAVAVAFVNLNATDSFSVSLLGAGLPLVPRSEYVLTPAAADDLRHVVLNGAGAPLGVSGGVVSPTPPRVVTDPAQPLVLAPHTYGFVVFSGANAAVCK
jgi:heparanase 1